MNENHRYIKIDQPGTPDVMQLAEGPRPVPGANEVLIRVAAAGINRPDVLQRRGVYPPPPTASPILGLEAAGIVAAIGSAVRQWQIGDAVCALTPGGGYAEYCVTPAAHCLPVPAGLSMIEAAALPETAFTVWGNLFRRGRLAVGETVLVHGGGSGIGTTAIQFAKAFGARVFVTANGADKCAACVALGADAAIDYASSDFVAEVQKLTDGRGVDAVLDIVGGDYTARNLAALGLDGRLLLVGFQRGTAATIDLSVILRKRIVITGSMLRPQTHDEKALLANDLRDKVWPLIEAGKIRPPIAATFPLAQAADAHRLMESSQHIGKIVLTL
ncbi:NAD(P)H-quinone oxidoreductase [Nevskia sp.]|uniref:NAD(P)H-quinone oxidoreductase n=1 Tax=Nevskia sp. TaxID=1929292 RepID=UPI0025E7A009|nr:NAD(P)H-quinone oxidoreductase [Nevskia sp.]